MSNMSLPAYFVGADVALKTTILMSLITPLPFGARKSYMRFLMTNKLVSKMVYFLKIVAIFVALLFLDAARTGWVVVLQPEKEGFNSGLDGGDPNAMVSTNLMSRKLLAERNMALTGVSLFLSFVCLRVFELSVENVRWGEIVHAQKGEDTGPPIDDHRAEFKANYDAQKPDHKAATKRRGMDKQNTSMAATS